VLEWDLVAGRFSQSNFAKPPVVAALSAPLYAKQAWSSGADPPSSRDT